MPDKLLLRKTAFITGATGGIGKQIALELAALGATVIIGARDRDKGQAVRADIIATTGNDRVRVAVLDVADPRSIRMLDLHTRLDILINNAGAWFSDRRTSVDGHELTFATNVLGPYLVTRHLLPTLAPGARIINIVSGFASNYDATDLELTRRTYAGVKAYAQSKQALRMLTWGLSARLATSGITVNAVAPGFVKTDFNQNSSGFMATVFGVMAKLFAVSPAKGADTAVWAATAPELAGVTGKLFESRKEKDGKFRDPDAIADLEARLEALVTPARIAA